MRVSTSSLRSVFSASTALQAAFFAFSFWSADISADIPNVKERIRAYEAQQDNAGASVEDLAILRREQEALEARMPFPGLKVGDTAPDFTLIDARGEQVRLYDALEKATVVLIFYRGSWCPYCNLQL